LNNVSSFTIKLWSSGQNTCSGNPTGNVSDNEDITGYNNLCGNVNQGNIQSISITCTNTNGQTYYQSQEYTQTNCAGTVSASQTYSGATGQCNTVTTLQGGSTTTLPGIITCAARANASVSIMVLILTVILAAVLN